MDEIIQTQLHNIRSKDKEVQNSAFTFMMAATEEPVTWAYDVWNELLVGLQDKDNRVRAISSQILSNLAKSDPEKRMIHDFASLLSVTKDERFVTARHCLQSLWKVGVVGTEQQKVYLTGLENRFHECISEKNCTLIRFDIIQSLRNVYDAVPDEALKVKALALIETEDKDKYQKKYAKVWR
jgi:hypothetical protein